jgi:hypothetical protein
MNAQLIGQGLNVAPIYWALLKNPQLWNEHTTRTASPESPHYGLDDIWLRYGEPERSVDGQPHTSFWYPSADVLGVKGLCSDILHFTNGVELGGVLITRIPPGKTCKPHVDPGWHARRYSKFAVQIASAPGQVFAMEDCALETKPGDLYWFDNQYLHWVENPTPYERVSMIICVRLET